MGRVEYGGIQVDTSPLRNTDDFVTLNMFEGIEGNNCFIIYSTTG